MAAGWSFRLAGQLQFGGRLSHRALGITIKIPDTIVQENTLGLGRCFGILTES